MIRLLGLNLLDADCHPIIPHAGRKFKRKLDVGSTGDKAAKALWDFAW